MIRRSAFGSALAFTCLLASTGEGRQVTRGPYLQSATSTSIHVRFRTLLPYVGRVDFGLSPTSLTSSKIESSPKAEHDLLLDNLTPGTRYFYRIGSTTQVFAGGDEAHSFVTPPPSGATIPTRAWILGDCGTANADARRVRDAYYAFTGQRRTDLWLLLGDNAYTTGLDSEYQTSIFENMYEAMLIQSPVWPTYGNHDGYSADALTQTGPYFNIFTLPTNGEAGGLPSGTEAYFSHDFGDIHFICLDSFQSDRSPTGPMATWLQNDLAQNHARFTIARWHHPPYTKGTHDSDLEFELYEMRATFNPILEAGGVDVVLCGHSHGYERTALIDSHYALSTTFSATNVVQPGLGTVGGSPYRKSSLLPSPHSGTIYVVCGCSGKIGVGTYDHPAMVQSMMMFGSLVLDANGDQLDLRFIDDNGATIDRFTLLKGGQSPVDISSTPLALGATWRYYDLPNPPIGDWTAANYDDSAWASGLAPLGYGETFIATSTTFGSDPLAKPITTWFRKSITLAESLLDVDSLRLMMKFDDGFVAYLDGVEIARSGFPTGHAITPNTPAFLHEGEHAQAVDVSAHRASFTAGTHQLAVEVHQNLPSSSDLVFDLGIEFDRFQPFLPPCAGGDYPAPLVHVNGSSGGTAHSVDILPGTQLSLAVDSPTGASKPFLLLAELGPTVHPPGFTTLPNLCLLPQYIVVDSIGTGLAALLPATPAPWQATFPPLAAPLEFTLQALFIEPASGFSTSNAVHVRGF